MRAFAKLYAKEMRAQTGLLVFDAVLVLVLDIALSTRIGVWEEFLPTGLSLLPFSVVPFAAIWLGFNVLRSEWAEGSVQWLLSLPVRGAHLAGAKLAAAVTTTLALAGMAGLGSYLVFRLEVGGIEGLAAMMGTPEAAPALRQTLASLFSPAMVLAVLAGLVWSVLLSMLAYAAGRTVHRYGWVLTGFTFFGGAYLLQWLGGLLEVRLQGLPPLVLSGIRIHQPRPELPLVVETLQLPIHLMPWIVITWAEAALLFWAVAHLLERRVEV